MQLLRMFWNPHCWRVVMQPQQSISKQNKKTQSLLCDETQTDNLVNLGTHTPEHMSLHVKGEHDKPSLDWSGQLCAFPKPIPP